MLRLCGLATTLRSTNIISAFSLSFRYVPVTAMSSSASSLPAEPHRYLSRPDTLDLSDLETLASPGMSFFMQLPGPEDATDAFDDMMTTAQNVAFQLGGELRDEQMSVMTGQTREHMRQRIADFARRRLSIRA